MEEDPGLTAGEDDETIDTLKDSVDSTRESSTISISTLFGPVSPALNVTSKVFPKKSRSEAEPALVVKLKIHKSAN